MKIKLRCKCGATAEWDAWTYINAGGTPDEKNRRFLVELRAEEWLNRHQICQPPTITGITVPSLPIGPVMCGAQA